MNTLTAVLVSIILAAGVSFAIASGFAPESRPLGVGEPDTRRLVDRLGQLERELARISRARHVGAASIGEPTAANSPVERTPVRTEARSSDIAELTVRLDAIERKLDTLGRDPLMRAHSYLASDSPRARREAIELLRRFAPFDPAAQEAIRSMLSDPDAGVRQEAVEAIGRTRDRDALPKIRSLLADENVRVRREAADALEDLLNGLPKDSAEFRAGIEDLAARASDADPRVREEVADTIGDLGPELAAPMLIGLLEDSESDVRDEAIEALGRSGDPAAVPHLRRLYDAGGTRNRLDIAIALSRLGDPTAFQQEATALVDNAADMKLSDRERARAVSILGRVDPASYRAVLNRALEDPSYRVRREAQRALRRNGR